jgi:hypothetical protein
MSVCADFSRIVETPMYWEFARSPGHPHAFTGAVRGRALALQPRQ